MVEPAEAVYPVYAKCWFFSSFVNASSDKCGLIQVLILRYA